VKRALRAVVPALVPVFILTGVLAACSGDDSGSGSSSGTGGGASADQIAAGKALAHDRGCPSCHSASGAPGTGPTWKGLYGSQVTLDDGTTVTADDTYIKESMTDPGAKIVKGFGNVMPHFNLSPKEQDELLAYIKSLA